MSISFRLASPGGSVDDGDKPKFKELMETTVEILQETIASIDFWQNPDKQKRVRGLIKTEITKAGIDALKDKPGACRCRDHEAGEEPPR